MNYIKNIDDAYNIVNISKSDIPNITRVILQIYDNFKITTSDNFLKLGSGWYAYAYLLKKFNVVALLTDTYSILILFSPLAVLSIYAERNFLKDF